jgi:CubicO group peptidase (beta-lactamase class C family)
MTHTTLQNASPAELGFIPERLQRLTSVLQDEIDRNRLPGAVGLIVRNGKLAWQQNLGWQDPGAKVPMAADSIFRIYSMTKPITSVAIMMLYEQGKLLLTDPVGRFIPEFAKQQVLESKNGDDVLRAASRAATVQDLLRHTSGLTYEFLGAQSIHRQYAQARMGNRDRANAEFMPALAQLPLAADPGTVWEYSRATDVLGRIIEVVSGQTLGEFFQQHIFKPLGMTGTAFSVPSSLHSKIAEPFAKDPDGAPQMKVYDVRSPAPFESGGGGLVGTAMDYARFMQFMLNRGELDGVRLLGARTVDFMTTDHLGNIPINTGGSSTLVLPGYGFGLGFAVRKSLGQAPIPGSVGLYYWGGLAGTTFFIDPALNLCATLMIQAPNQREYFRFLFRDLVYAALAD